MKKRRVTMPFGCGKKALMKETGSCESKYNRILADTNVFSDP